VVCLHVSLGGRRGSDKDGLTTRVVIQTDRRCYEWKLCYDSVLGVVRFTNAPPRLTKADRPNSLFISQSWNQPKTRPVKASCISHTSWDLVHLIKYTNGGHSYAL
jgi:hypothetical protein